jgi:C4-type Zn-finger protein
MSASAFKIKADAIELILLEKRTRIEQLKIALKKGRCSEPAISLLEGRIPVLESILNDYRRALAREQST